ncbi:hypothetical protein CYY_003628 [Polysphondylium violaceum]|uniref:Carbohydrate binding domain-containing protein n=1 Tax=Polysphondylium violaceum TaxID=133409 RepID=A0A8J4UU51_9MYCE|nr:hypothetical protein CYY_003628 [Polysphondylium violaceum]
MKFFVALLFALIAISVSSTAAHDFQCGVYRCPDMHACVCDAGVFRCVYRCDEVIITQTVTRRWADNNGQLPYAQVEVSVKNVGHRMVKDVTIGTVGMNLKDNNAIWGISTQGNDIHLPSYVDLAPGQTHQFGYINKGNNAATLYVKNVNLH